MATVLIVDDSRTSRRILRGVLENGGFEVIGEATNGEEALSMFQQLHPQVVFLDVDMPEKNGIECARAIQDMANREAAKHVPAPTYLPQTGPLKIVHGDGAIGVSGGSGVSVRLHLGGNRCHGRSVTSNEVRRVRTLIGGKAVVSGRVHVNPFQLTYK